MKTTTYLVGGPAHGMAVGLDNNRLSVEIVSRFGRRSHYDRRRYFRTGANGEPTGEPYVVFEIEGATSEQRLEIMDRIDGDPTRRKDDDE